MILKSDGNNFDTSNDHPDETNYIPSTKKFTKGFSERGQDNDIFDSSMEIGCDMPKEEIKYPRSDTCTGKTRQSGLQNPHKTFNLEKYSFPYFQIFNLLKYSTGSSKPPTGKTKYYQSYKVPRNKRKRGTRNNDEIDTLVGDSDLSNEFGNMQSANS